MYCSKALWMWSLSKHLLLSSPFLWWCELIKCLRDEMKEDEGCGPYDVALGCWSPSDHMSAGGPSLGSGWQWVTETAGRESLDKEDYCRVTEAFPHLLSLIIFPLCGVICKHWARRWPTCGLKRVGAQSCDGRGRQRTTEMLGVEEGKEGGLLSEGHRVSVSQHEKNFGE